MERPWFCKRAVHGVVEKHINVDGTAVYVGRETPCDCMPPLPHVKKMKPTAVKGSRSHSTALHRKKENEAAIRSNRRLQELRAQDFNRSLGVERGGGDGGPIHKDSGVELTSEDQIIRPTGVTPFTLIPPCERRISPLQSPGTIGLVFPGECAAPTAVSTPPPPPPFTPYSPSYDQHSAGYPTTIPAAPPYHWNTTWTPPDSTAPPTWTPSPPTLPPPTSEVPSYSPLNTPNRIDHTPPPPPPLPLPGERASLFSSTPFPATPPPSLATPCPLNHQRCQGLGLSFCPSCGVRVTSLLTTSSLTCTSDHVKPPNGESLHYCGYCGDTLVEPPSPRPSGSPPQYPGGVGSFSLPFDPQPPPPTTTPPPSYEEIASADRKTVDAVLDRLLHSFVNGEGTCGLPGCLLCSGSTPMEKIDTTALKHGCGSLLCAPAVSISHYHYYK